MYISYRYAIVYKARSTASYSWLGFDLVNQRLKTCQLSVLGCSAQNNKICWTFKKTGGGNTNRNPRITGMIGIV